MAQKDDDIDGKPWLHENAKETRRKQKRAVTPRIAVLYLDQDRRQKTIESRRLVKEQEERKKCTFSPMIRRNSCSQSPH